jgi:hypothetical protein
VPAPRFRSPVMPAKPVPSPRLHTARSTEKSNEKSSGTCQTLYNVSLKPVLFAIT